MAGKRRGKEGGNGGEDVVEWGRKQEKLKSAIRKKLICDHIVFFENPVWGIFYAPNCCKNAHFRLKMPQIMPQNQFGAIF